MTDFTNVDIPGAEGLQMWPTEQLQDLRDWLEERVASIKTQIGDARSRVHVDGEYSDADWYRRAMAAQRLFAQRFNVVLRILGERRKAMRRDRNDSRERAFVAVAKRVLKPETYAAIWAEVDAQGERTA